MTIQEGPAYGFGVGLDAVDTAVQATVDLSDARERPLSCVLLDGFEAGVEARAGSRVRLAKHPLVIGRAVQLRHLHNHTSRHSLT